MKPVQSGCESRNGDLYAPDLIFILDINGIEASPEESHLMCPCTLELPCSPHLAAERAGREIETGPIVESYHRLAERHEMIIVEGAGGLLVPVNAKIMMIDLIKMLNLPVILVARPGLGTLNHTLLSLRELRRQNIAVTGVAFCETEPAAGDYIEEDNKKTVARLGNVTILGTLPHIADMDSLRHASARFRQIAEENFPNVKILWGE